MASFSQNGLRGIDFTLMKLKYNEKLNKKLKGS